LLDLKLSCLRENLSLKTKLRSNFDFVCQIWIKTQSTLSCLDYDIFKCLWRHYSNCIFSNHHAHLLNFFGHRLPVNDYFIIVKS